MYCKHCGAKNEEEVKFCTHCGEKDSVKSDSWSRKTVKLIIYIIVGILVLGVISDRILYSINSNRSQNSFNSATQTEPNFLDGSQPNGRVAKLAYITEVVDGIKKELTLPHVIDEKTSLVNVRAENDSIHYYYVISGSEFSEVSNESMKSLIIESFCSNEASTNLINRGINIKYTYSGNSMKNNIDVIFEKKDCID